LNCDAHVRSEGEIRLHVSLQRVRERPPLRQHRQRLPDKEVTAAATTPLFTADELMKS
jgi:hypothetical protein